MCFLQWRELTSPPVHGGKIASVGRVFVMVEVVSSSLMPQANPSFSSCAPLPLNYFMFRMGELHPAVPTEEAAPAGAVGGDRTFRPLQEPRFLPANSRLDVTESGELLLCC